MISAGERDFVRACSYTEDDSVRRICFELSYNLFMVGEGKFELEK